MKFLQDYLMTSNLLSMISATGWFKVFNKEEKHHDHQYVPGINILQDEFAQKGSCVSGGFYFTTAKYIFKYLFLGDHIRPITLPIDDPAFLWVQDHKKWRANMIILEEPEYSLSDPETFIFLESQGAVISYDVLRWAHGSWRTQIVEFLFPKLVKRDFLKFLNTVSEIDKYKYGYNTLPNYSGIPVASLGFAIVRDDPEMVEDLLIQYPELEELLQLDSLLKWIIRERLACMLILLLIRKGPEFRSNCDEFIEIIQVLKVTKRPFLGTILPLISLGQAIGEYDSDYAEYILETHLKLDDDARFLLNHAMRYFANLHLDKAHEIQKIRNLLDKTDR